MCSAISFNNLSLSSTFLYLEYPLIPNDLHCSCKDLIELVELVELWELGILFSILSEHVIVSSWILAVLVVLVLVVLVTLVFVVFVALVTLVFVALVFVAGTGIASSDNSLINWLYSVSASLTSPQKEEETKQKEEETKQKREETKQEEIKLKQEEIKLKQLELQIELEKLKK